MAKLFFDNQGNIIRFLKNELDEKLHGPPKNFTSQISFDHRTNGSLINDISHNRNIYKNIAGALTKGLIPVIINAPGQNTSDRSELNIIMAKLRNDQNITQNELRIVLRTIIREIKLDN